MEATEASLASTAPEIFMQGNTQRHQRHITAKAAKMLPTDIWAAQAVKVGVLAAAAENVT